MNSDFVRMREHEEEMSGAFDGRASVLGASIIRL